MMDEGSNKDTYSSSFEALADCETDDRNLVTAPEHYVFYIECISAMSVQT